MLEWSLWQLGVTADLESIWADFRGVKQRPVGLAAKVAKAIELYPCDLLFVHRDSEGDDVNNRLIEIAASTAALNGQPPHVCVVPVRMLESWLLLSEGAVRSAAGNPLGSVPLAMPRLRDVENVADPKAVLFSLLRMASERTGRKLRSFDVENARTLVSQYVQDFAPLRILPSFQLFESELRQVVHARQFDRWV